MKKKLSRAALDKGIELSWKQESARHRQALNALSNGVASTLGQIDALSKQPASLARGQAVARALNALEQLNNGIRAEVLCKDEVCEARKFVDALPADD